MLFNTFEFVIFFPVVTLLYFLVPYSFRRILLLVASCVFYMFFKWEYIFILLFTIIIDYFAGIWIHQNTGKKRKWALALSIIANVAVLGLFKYYYFIIDNINLVSHKLGSHAQYDALYHIILPIGLSFHTFQAMSYTIEVYRGKQEVERNFLTFSLYVMFYPQLVAGPIERPQNVLWQFYEKFDFDFQKAKSGLRLMLWGLFKKVLIADNLSVYVDNIYGNLQYYHGLPIIFAMVAYAILIYCDFSGYSDIALGSARVMGFNLMQNFDRPYSSKSISEFWRRWHISLSTWFRDYVYIPLGGNRVGTFRQYLNLMIIFLLSGLWHGASWNFIIWGGLHGLYLIFGQLTAKLQDKILGKGKFADLLHNIATVILVVFAWIFFRAPNFKDAKYIIKNTYQASSHSISEVINIIGVKEFIVLVIGILIMQTVHYIQSKQSVSQYIDAKPRWIQWSAYYGLLIMILSFGFFDKIQFIYFQF